MDEDSVAMNMILTDEIKRMRNEGSDKKLTLIEKENVTISTPFTVKGQDFNGNPVNMPIEGKGVLDSFIAIAKDSEAFSVSVEVDNNDVINRKSYSELERISTELSRIGAYKKTTDAVVSVSGYPFKERLNIRIYPDEDIEFDIIRAEVIEGTANADESGKLDPEIANLLQ